MSKPAPTIIQKTGFGEYEKQETTNTYVHPPPPPPRNDVVIEQQTHTQTYSVPNPGYDYSHINTHPY